MAKAPRPGSAGTTGGDEKVKAARQTVAITLRHPDHDPITRTLCLGSVPFRERAVVRKATGMPFETFMVNDEGASIGLDTVQVWWWLATRAEKGPMVSLDKALADWPEEITGDTFGIDFDDGEDDDPQS